MSSWFPFQRMEELSFKRVPEGFVFQAPNSWLVGPRRHYLVNEAQKAELTARLRGMWRHLAIAILGAIAVGVPLSMAFGLDKHPLANLAASAAVGLVVGGVVTAYSLRTMQRLLVGLTPTNERITQRDALRTQVAVFSRGYLIAYGLLSLALFVAIVLPPLLSAEAWDLTSILGALLFGAATLYWAAIYWAKRRDERAVG